MPIHRELPSCGESKRMRRPPTDGVDAGEETGSVAKKVSHSDRMITDDDDDDNH